MTRGTLSLSPPFRVASADAATFQAQLSATSTGAQLLELAGNPVCGIDIYHIEFWTVGAVGEATLSSGALMVPTGAAPGCSGPRPIVMYAHGTTTAKQYNIADIVDATNPAYNEGVLIAAVFAAQGYIVVAPNYAGYDISTLGYHPFLNASQQSGEMMDALTAARTALPTTYAASTTDSGKLYLTGYSQGGYVAMATERAMEQAGMTVTAAAPMSGPYALEALFDTVYFGSVNVDSPLFSPLVTTSYQRAYGNVYNTPSDVYSATYATGIDTLLPSMESATTLIDEGKLPASALFNSTTPVVTVSDPTESAALTAALAVPNDPSNPFTPAFQAGFGDPYLVNNSARVAYAQDQYSNPDGVASGGSALAAAVPTLGMRKDVYVNDLRNGNWAPSAPTLMCGGSGDPTVFYDIDTGIMTRFWSSVTSTVILALDVDPPGGPSGSGGIAQLQAAFQSSQASELAYLQTPAGGGLTLAQAQLSQLQNYHVSVAPFCTLAARAFFQTFP
jgi:hypothetical protein